MRAGFSSDRRWRLDGGSSGTVTPGHDDVVPTAQGAGEDEVDLVVQEAVRALVGPHDGDEYDDLVVGAVRSHLVDELDERLDDGGVVGVQHLERHPGVPSAPVVAETVGVAVGLVAAYAGRR